MMEGALSATYCRLHSLQSLLHLEYIHVGGHLHFLHGMRTMIV